MTILAIVFLLIVTVLYLLGKSHGLVISYYFSVCLITFLAYAVDKRAAKRSDRRISENTLHLFSLIGGWPGAIIAQQRLRHKTIKAKFRFLFWITVFVNLAIFIWFHTPTGAHLLNGFVNGCHGIFVNLMKMVDK